MATVMITSTTTHSTSDDEARWARYCKFWIDHRNELGEVESLSVNQQVLDYIRGRNETNFQQHMAAHATTVRKVRIFIHVQALAEREQRRFCVFLSRAFGMLSNLEEVDICGSNFVGIAILLQNLPGPCLDVTKKLELIWEGNEDGHFPNEATVEVLRAAIVDLPHLSSFRWTT